MKIENQTDVKTTYVSTIGGREVRATTTGDPQVTTDGSRKYLVWIRRCGATACNMYEADNAE